MQGRLADRSLELQRDAEKTIKLGLSTHNFKRQTSYPGETR